MRSEMVAFFFIFLFIIIVNHFIFNKKKTFNKYD